MVNVIRFILVPFLPSDNSLLLARITRLKKTEYARQMPSARLQSESTVDTGCLGVWKAGRENCPIVKKLAKSFLIPVTIFLYFLF